MGPSRSCWNSTTNALQLEEITSKGTSFMCVLSIKVPIQKSLETYLMILIALYNKIKMFYFAKQKLFIIKLVTLSKCSQFLYVRWLVCFMVHQTLLDNFILKSVY